MINQLISQTRLTYRLILDDRVPMGSKVIPLLTLAYILSPLDFMPDFLPLIGVVDDVFIVIGGMRLFAMVVPQDIVAEHRAALGME